MRFATVLEKDSGFIRVVVVGQDGALVDASDFAIVSRGGERWRESLDELTSIINNLDPFKRRCQEHADAAPSVFTLKYKDHPPQFLPPIPFPRSFRDFYAFEQHVKSARARRGLEMQPAWYEQPVFYFSNAGTLIGHEAEVCAPQGSNELDFELELGVVIGRGGKNIDPADIWKHVAGFTIINDFSARDIQRREMAVGLGPAKGKDFATAAGPWLLTLDELQDRIDAQGRISLDMRARVNGRELSHGNSGSMYFTWPRIIAHASLDAELFPGDLIGSGTVGTGCILELGPENTGGWLKPGDVVELEIERLGILRNRVVANPRA